VVSLTAASVMPPSFNKSWIVSMSYFLYYANHDEIGLCAA
jgi:hypothetical protein